MRNVFSIFAAVGIDLPLTPDAFMGLRSGQTPDVVIWFSSRRARLYALQRFSERGEELLRRTHGDFSAWIA